MIGSLGGSMRNRKPEKKASLLTPVVFCLATSALGGELGLWQSMSEPLNERQDAEVAVSPNSASASPSINQVDETLHVFAGRVKSRRESSGEQPPDATDESETQKPPSEPPSGGPNV